jgi:hypothetical protein
MTTTLARYSPAYQLAVFLPARGEDALLGDCLTIPIQTTYILPVENEATGYVVAAWLNSLPVRAYAVSFAERARGAYFRHISWDLGLLPVPGAIHDLLQNGHTLSGNLKELRRLSQELHANPLRPDRQALEQQVDAIIATLYELRADEDIAAIRSYVDFIGSKGASVTCGVSTLTVNAGLENTAAKEVSRMHISSILVASVSQNYS